VKFDPEVSVADEVDPKSDAAPNACSEQIARNNAVAITTEQRREFMMYVLHP
jgi:hypothetical protein